MQGAALSAESLTPTSYALSAKFLTCASLQLLDLSECRHLAELPDLTGCLRLQTLNLSKCDQVSDLSALAGCTVFQEQLNDFEKVEVEHLSLRRGDVELGI